jgi:hypothetical protein
MIDLIDKIEKATRPDRILDALIEVELRRWQAYDAGLNDKTRATWQPIGTRGEVICGQGLTRYHAPTYTFEMDKAALLVPEGFCFDMQSVLRGTAIFDKSKAWAQVEEISGPIIENSACATLPLAICAAALRAQSSRVSRPHQTSGDSA